jgi:curved DNA-binding protein CbpA
MGIDNLISIVFVFAVAFYFSKKAQSLFFHLLYSYIGFYLIFHSGFINPLYNQKLIVGIALLTPQLKFLVQFTQDTIQNIKMMSANTYYFFVTLYYKVIRFIHWVQNIPQEINDFFSSFGNSQQENRQNKYQERDEYRYKQKHQKFYEENETKEEYKEQKTEERYTQSSSDEFAQFYSESAYIILGVSSDDDFTTIKKAYRKLVRKYHPDLNPDNIELYTEITQHINDAYEKVERWKKI